MARIIKVLRVLEYEGDADEVFTQLEKRAVKGSYTIRRFGSAKADFIIREAILGESITIFQPSEEEAINRNTGFVVEVPNA